MPKILIVEDDALTAKMYGDFLRRAGFEVEVAANGVAALEHIMASPPEGMLVDMMMPGMNGIDFIKTLRADEKFQSIPVLAYTTAFVPHFIQQATKVGATDVFDKSKLNGPLLKAAFEQYLDAASS